MKILIDEFLTENRYWTFWSNDYSERINVFWGGRTKWSDIKKVITERLGSNFGYERQIELRNPDLTFE